MLRGDLTRAGVGVLPARHCHRATLIRQLKLERRVGHAALALRPVRLLQAALQHKAGFATVEHAVVVRAGLHQRLDELARLRRRVRPQPDFHNARARGNVEHSRRQLLVTPSDPMRQLTLRRAFEKL